MGSRGTTWDVGSRETTWDVGSSKHLERGLGVQEVLESGNERAPGIGVEPGVQGGYR